MAIALEEGCSVRKGVDSNLYSPLLQSSVQALGQVKDRLQLEEQSPHLQKKQRLVGCGGCNGKCSMLGKSNCRALAVAAVSEMPVSMVMAK